LFQLFKNRTEAQKGIFRPCIHGLIDDIKNNDADMLPFLKSKDLLIAHYHSSSIINYLMIM